MAGLLAPAVEIEIEIKNEQKESEDSSACPTATQDIEENLANRQKAIDKANYGPMNPNEPNSEYWRELSKGWRLSPDQAKRSRCGNCAAFIQTPTMLDCIAKGVGEPDAWDVIDAGDLGYCDLFHFKCASKRTCAAWIVGGPVTEESDMSETEGEDNG
ncbi:MAG: hypothetical protein ACO24H_11020 [Polynucleobacter sp.]